MKSNIVNVTGRSRYMASAALLFACALVAQAADHVITIGYAASPVIQAMKSKHPTVDGRVLARNRKNADARIARKATADITSAKFVVADLAEVEPTDEDVALVDAARESGVPVVLENVTAERMAAFLGTGVQNSLVVIEFSPRLRTNKVTLFDETLASGEAEVPKPPKFPTFADRLGFAEHIATERPYMTASSMKPMDASLTVATNPCANLPSSLSGSCIHSFYATPDYQWCPPMVTVAGTSIRNIYYPSVWSCANGMGRIDPQWDITMVRAHDASGNDGYWVRIAIDGGWGFVDPNGSGAPQVADTDYYKGPLISKYLIAVNPMTNGVGHTLPPMWKLMQTAPQNVNNQGSMSYSTGWNVSGTATCGADSGGGNCSASLSVGYGQTTTSTTTVNDWSVQNNSDSRNGVFSYYMSGVTCNGKDLVSVKLTSDLTTAMACGGLYMKLAEPPSWSFNGYSGGLAEMVYFGPATNTVGSAQFFLNKTITLQDQSILSLAGSVHTAIDTRTLNDSFLVNPTKLH